MYTRINYSHEYQFTNNGVKWIYIRSKIVIIHLSLPRGRHSIYNFRLYLTQCTLKSRYFNYLLYRTSSKDWAISYFVIGTTRINGRFCFKPVHTFNGHRNNSLLELVPNRCSGPRLIITWIVSSTAGQSCTEILHSLHSARHALRASLQIIWIVPIAHVV